MQKSCHDIKVCWWLHTYNIQACYEVVDCWTRVFLCILQSATSHGTDILSITMDLITDIFESILIAKKNTFISGEIAACNNRCARNNEMKTRSARHACLLEA